MKNDYKNFDYRKFYDEDERFKRFVDRECVKQQWTVDEALQIAIVKETAHCYVEADESKIDNGVENTTETKIIAGCGGACEDKGEVK